MGIIYVILIVTFLETIKCSIKHHICQLSTVKGYQFIRYNELNVVQLKNVLISSRNTNTIGNNNHSVMQNAIYPYPSSSTVCTLNKSITLDLLQHYQLNTIILWLYENDSREFNFVVYSIQNTYRKELIYETLIGKGIIKIQFKTQFVKQIILWNRGGNTVNNNLNVRKVIAFKKNK